MYYWLKLKLLKIWKEDSGMELIQVAILIAIAIGVGLIFKDKITDFVKDVFQELAGDSFL